MPPVPIKMPVRNVCSPYASSVIACCILLIFLFSSKTGYNQSQKITIQNAETGQDMIRHLLDSADVNADAGNYRMAQQYCEQALVLSALQANTKQQIEIKRKQGDIAYYAGEYNQSIQYYHSAKAMAENIADGEDIVLTNLDLGYAFYDAGKPDSSQYYVLQSLKLNKQISDTISMVHAYHILGDIHYGVENFQSAYDYYEQGIQLIKQMESNIENHIAEYSTLLGNQAGAAAEIGKYDESKKCYIKSDSLAALIDDEHTLAFNAYGLGYTYLYEGNFRKAVNLCNSALKYFIAEEDTYSIEGCMECMARSYLGMNKLDSAEYYLLPILKSMDNYNFIDFKIDVYEQLTMLYEKRGNYKTSLEYFKKYKILNDSLNVQNRTVNLNLIEIQERYQQAEKDFQALTESRVKDQQVIAAQQNSNLYITIALILAILCVFTLGIFYKNKRNHSALLEHEVQKRTEELSNSNMSLLEANAELEEFARISSHDLREPIRNIVSFSSLIKRKGQNLSQTELDDFISLIQFNGNQMLQLVNDIYEFTKIKKTNLEIKRVQISTVVNEAVKLLSTEIKSKNAIIKTEIEAGELLTNNNMLVLALRNIIENGITYNRSDPPEIVINAQENAEEFIFSIRDNGIGIDPKYHARIFEMFKRLHNREEYPGSGLGLAITKKIIARLKGTIEVNSEEGRGSVFIIHIPKYVQRPMQTSMKKAS